MPRAVPRALVTPLLEILAWEVPALVLAALLPGVHWIAVRQRLDRLLINTNLVFPIWGDWVLEGGGRNSYTCN